MKFRRMSGRLVATIVLYVSALIVCCALQLWKLAGLVGIVALATAMVREVIEHIASGRRRKRLDEPEGMTSMLNVGAFPVHLPYLATFVGRRPSRCPRLWVLSDCSDYGTISDPESSQEILHQLVQAAAEGMDVRVLVCGKPACFTRVNRLRELGFKKLMHTREMKRFLRFHGLSSSPPKSRDELLDLLSNIQQATKKYLLDNGVHVRELPNERPGQFLWIKGNEAVVIYSDAGSKAQAGFWDDRKMVNCFRATFEDYWAKLPADDKQLRARKRAWSILRDSWRRTVAAAARLHTPKSSTESPNSPVVN
jgi:hypothetical protein